MCPYIVDWSMRDEMSGMPKKQQLFLMQQRSIPVCLTFISQGICDTLQCHFNQPRPFSHYRAKEASDFDGHRFTKKKVFFTTRESLYSYHETIRSPVVPLKYLSQKVWFILIVTYFTQSLNPLRAFMYIFFTPVIFLNYHSFSISLYNIV